MNTTSEKPATLERALLRIEELEAEISALTPKPPIVTDREQKILARMTKGRLRREAAEVAVDQQAIEDGQRAAQAAKKSALKK